MARVGCVGECMVELSALPDGLLRRSFGGDTLNTAIYLARLGVSVDYVTALGDDGWSDAMLAAWADEGVGTSQVLRFAGRLPGLYVIETDAGGERRFSYWRDRAPAREIFDCPQTPSVAAALQTFDYIYLSGISLSLYGDAGRARLFDAIDAARGRGTKFVFDTNFRPRGWPDIEAARRAFSDAMQRADTLFASADDLVPLWGNTWSTVAERTASEAEIIEKLRHPACRIRVGDRKIEIPAPTVANVIDTTAAGDSFAAAYLAARIAGSDPSAAVAAGHRLASTVVQHRGAIIPRDAMPTPPSAIQKSRA